MEFDPTIVKENPKEVKWVSYREKHIQSLPVGVRTEEVAKGKNFNFEDLTFRDPNFYIAEHLHKHILEW